MDKWETPYNGLRCSKTKFAKKYGVYFVRDKHTRELLYIGKSQYCLYKGLYIHFYRRADDEWRVCFDKEDTSIEARMIVTEKEKAHLYEKRLIQYFKPKLNTITYKTVDVFECFTMGGGLVITGELEEVPF